MVHTEGDDMSHRVIRISCHGLKPLMSFLEKTRKVKTTEDEYQSAEQNVQRIPSSVVVTLQLQLLRMTVDFHAIAAQIANQGDPGLLTEFDRFVSWRGP